MGDSEVVLQHSRPLILDPLAGHPESARRVTDANLRGTVKDLAQLDGAFVISESGIFVAACRYLDANAQLWNYHSDWEAATSQPRRYQELAQQLELLFPKLRLFEFFARACSPRRSSRNYGD
jgi:hypothetical protein